MATHIDQSYWHSRSLAGLRVIVTGAARGVGKGVTAALLERGAAVLMVDRDPAVAEVAESFGADGRAAPLVTDLCDRSSYRHIVDEAVQVLGGIDALINNAIATNEPKPFTDITGEDFDLVFDTGPRATLFLMQAAYPVLKAGGGGSIVNFGSGSGTAGQKTFGAYAGAKEAIRGISKVAALEWGRDNIRVNVVCPFAQSDGVAGWSEEFPDVYNKIVKGIPLRRIGDTHADIGPMVAFLVSPDASYLTAQTIHVDGGMGMYR
ncbi:SDR family NAD(P)-dependent oxidoreductase [Mycolicibacterium helvum]|uniref:Short-chain dehydrogenase n=1 Tax=Mycolicibacterium helvum TaxID=1534349 RepID=A0A7I7T4B0_9MYCO|nr:SDR family NAD(P)-dependent oxidoreductase [Mycolicibacterium helvum]BBY62936.1 short-chain dehydrogenase [Mycolicibacterium helvum]